MEKMIKVINDNLRNVINGIIEHKTDLETTLDTIRNDMAIQVNEANTYKSDVENARTIISSLENEITELEDDLEELNSKFGSRDFKEIVAAGNKEINAKITEKKAMINEQGQVIVALTEKARKLKDSLIELREKKIQTEDNLVKTRILLGYFETRINEIIKFSEENPNELESYKDEIPQEELNTQEDVDINSIIDGTIFEEIDEISTGEPDADLLKSVLENPDDIPVYVQEEEEVKEELEVTTTNQLESMISDAKAFMEKNAKLLNQDSLDTEEEEEVVEEETGTSGVEEDNSNIDKALEEIKEAAQKEIVKEEKEENEDTFDEELNEDFIDIFDESKKETVPVDLDELQKELDASVDEDEDDDAIDLEIADDEDLPVIDFTDSLIASAEAFKDTFDDIDKEIEDCGIDVNKLNEEDVILLKSAFDKDIISKSMDILVQNEISSENIHNNVKVLTSVTPQNLENIIDLMKKAGAKTVDLNALYQYIDKINMNKLEQIILTSDEVSLTAAVVEALPETENDNIGDILGLDRKDSEILKKSASEEDYRIMNTLPNIVKANYEEVKALEVDAPNECISKYPHRFTLCNSEFHDILDKYDTEDLIRCINKNVAVIDKL